MPAGFSGKVCVEKLLTAPGAATEADRLVGDTRVLCGSTGETVLEVVSLTTPAGANQSNERSDIGQPSRQVIQIQIQRSTMHRWESGGQNMTGMTYCMDIGALLRIKSLAR